MAEQDTLGNGTSSSNINSELPITYKDNFIEVKNPKKQSITVYAHPADKILFDFDIAALKKEVVNGDLVIHTYQGGKVTIANFAIMAMQEESPIITDILSRNYQTEDLLVDRPKITTDDPTSYVVNRKLSSPETQGMEGKFLSHSKVTEEAEADLEKFTGNIEIDQQSPIVSLSVLVQPYPISTLRSITEVKYDVNEVFDYNGRTIYNQEEPDNKPIPIIRVAPGSAPYYGSRYEITDGSESGKYDTTVTVSNGGGNLYGVENAKYLFEPQVIDLKTEASNKTIHYIGSNNNTIYRSFEISLPGGSVVLQELRISGVPKDIKLVRNDKTNVQQVGEGEYIITPRVQKDRVEVSMLYNTETPDSFSNWAISAQGFNFRFNKLVYGETTLRFNFLKVNSYDDISEGFNNYTYSTNIDPLLIITSDGDDLLVGGIANHLFQSLGGADIFRSGSGNERVELGDRKSVV